MIVLLILILDQLKNSRYRQIQQVERSTSFTSHLQLWLVQSQLHSYLGIFVILQLVKCILSRPLYGQNQRLSCYFTKYYTQYYQFCKLEWYYLYQLVFQYQRKYILVLYLLGPQVLQLHIREVSFIYIHVTSELLQVRLE